MADLPVDAVESLPSYWWFGIAAVVLLVSVALAGCWGLFGLPVLRRPRWFYRGRRHVSRRRPNQVRPADIPPQPLADDGLQLIPVGEPLAIEPSTRLPPPYWIGQVQQHRYRRDPLVTCDSCEKPTVDCGGHEEVLSRG